MSKKKNIKIINKQKRLKLVDLCAGTGAFSLAFNETGLVDIVYANDMEESSKIIYDFNFDHKLTLGNLCNVEPKNIPVHDILTAGFPCQGFSIAGKQKGFNDPRSNVFWKILEIAKYHKTKCIILENVKNIVTHDNGNTIKTILESLEKEGYFVKYKVLNTSTITDVPQHRERTYFVCLRDKNKFEQFDFTFPIIEKKKEIKELLQTTPIIDKYYYNDQESKIHKMVMQEVVKDNTVYQFRRIYVRENKSNECPTLTANMGTGGHNVPLVFDEKGARKLTPRECFNFQGFPETYKLPKLSDSKLYKLAGNAVSVPVVKLLVDKIIKLIN